MCVLDLGLARGDPNYSTEVRKYARIFTAIAMAATTTPFDYVQFMKYGGGGNLCSAPASREASTTSKRATYRNHLKANHTKADKNDVEYVGSGTEQSEVLSEKFGWSDTDDISSPPPRKRTKREKRERNADDFGLSVHGTKQQPHNRSRARRWQEEEDRLLIEGYPKFIGSSAIYADLAKYIAQETARKRGDVRSRAQTLANTHPELRKLMRQQFEKVRGGSR
ncbi:hypothetical protein HDU85_003323 [Gaertneriomyces sp. JEL0708]|nr:hypothetical protein HDU85_003323 [Gaertneriomyces sp. JEL0708]